MRDYEEPALDHIIAIAPASRFDIGMEADTVPTGGPQRSNTRTARAAQPGTAARPLRADAPGRLPGREPAGRAGSLATLIMSPAGHNLAAHQLGVLTLRGEAATPDSE